MATTVSSATTWEHSSGVGEPTSGRIVGSARTMSRIRSWTCRSLFAASALDIAPVRS